MVSSIEQFHCICNVWFNHCVGEAFNTGTVHGTAMLQIVCLARYTIKEAASKHSMVAISCKRSGLVQGEAIAVAIIPGWSRMLCQCCQFTCVAQCVTGDEGCAIMSLVLWPKAPISMVSYIRGISPIPYVGICLDTLCSPPQWWICYSWSMTVCFGSCMSSCWSAFMISYSSSLSYIYI